MTQHEYHTQPAHHKAEEKSFKNYRLGYIDIDITQVYTEEGKLYLFVGIDRLTNFASHTFTKTKSHYSRPVLRQT